MRLQIKLFAPVFILLFFAAAPALYAQQQTIPEAVKYSVVKKFDVKKLGVNEPFELPYITYFCDDITLEDFNLSNFSLNPGSATAKNEGSICKNVVVIANTLRISGNNSIIIESFAGSEANRDGGSVTFICRKLILTEEARLLLSGTTGFPGVKNWATPLGNNYAYGYGTQFYFAAEQVVFEGNGFNTLKATFLARLRQLMEQMKGYTVDLTYPFNNIYLRTFSPVTMLTIMRKYRSELSPADTMIIHNLAKPGNIVNDSLITRYLYLAGLEYNDTRNVYLFSSLFWLTDRAKLSSSAIYTPPFISLKSTDLPPVPPNNQANYANFNKIYGTPLGLDASSFITEKLKTLTGQNVIDPRSYEIVGALFDENAMSKLPSPLKKLFSAWAAEWMKYMNKEIISAKLLGNRKRFFSLLKQVVEMPRYQLDAPYDDEYFSKYTATLEMLNEAQNLVSSDQATLSTPFQGRILSYLKRGLPESFYLHPTDIVINGIRNTAAFNYGILEIVETPEKSYKLRMEAELVSDPLAAGALSAALEAKYGRGAEPGLMPGIVYELAAAKTDGIINSAITVAGSLVSVTLYIRPESISSAMFQLSTAGLQVNVRWKLPGNPEQQGESLPLLLRLNKRVGHNIKINGLTLENTRDNAAVTIAYLTTSKGRTVFLKDARINAGGTYALDATMLAPGETIAGIPDLALSYNDGSFEQTINRFMVLENNGVAEKVVVKNTIPAIITPPGTELSMQVQSVDFTLTLLSDEQSGGIPLTNKSLSPAGSFGAEAQVVTPRISVQQNRYQLTGTVRFSDGGTARLSPIPFQGSRVDITTDKIIF